MEVDELECPHIRKIVEEIQREVDGIGYVYRAYLASLILGLFFAVIMLAATSSVSSVAGAVSAAFTISGVFALANAAIIAPLLYKGFEILAATSIDYDIGFKGSILWGIGNIATGITLIILATRLPSSIGSSNKLISTITGYIAVTIVVGLVAFIGGLMMLVALWRLGDAYPEYGGDVSKIGLVLWILGYLLQLLHLGGGGLLAFIGGLVLLYGLYQISTRLENILSEKEYELSRCKKGLDSENG